MPSEGLPEHWLFVDQTENDVGAMFAILLGAMIAAGGGLGGGGVFVPIYILILGYPPKFAAALSQATIFGGSIVNLIMNLRKTHPTRQHRPLTDFCTLLIFEPMLLVGTIVGVLLNVIFPDILILILLALVLSYATIRTTRKGIRLWKKESVEMNRERALSHSHVVDPATESNEANESNAKTTNSTEIEIDGKPSEKEEAAQTAEVRIAANTSNDAVEVIAAGSKPIETEPKPASKPTEKADEKPASDPALSIVPANAKESANRSKLVDELADACGCDPKQISDNEKVAMCQSFVEKESQIMQPGVIILVVWVFVSGFAILRKEEFTHIPECDIMYWIVTFLPLPLMMAVSWFMTKKEYDYYQVKANSDVWVPAFGDIKLDGSFVKIMKYPAIASVAGVLGGLLGIGGGMIVSPLLIELGVIPTVAAATSAMAVMITSSSAMLQFMLLGFLQVDYTLFFMLIGIVGTYVGQTAVNHAVKEYGRVSVVIFAVATVMALAIVLMTVNGAISLVDGVSWAFSAPC